MGDYQKNWIQLLKQQQFPDWEIGEHGQAIVVKVAPERNLKEIERQLPETLAALSGEVKEPKQWLKFIFYNGTNWFQYILN